MLIGIPKEIKDQEYRVAVTPDGVAALMAAGHQVLVHASASRTMPIALPARRSWLMPQQCMRRS